MKTWSIWISIQKRKRGFWFKMNSRYNKIQRYFHSTIKCLDSFRIHKIQYCARYSICKWITMWNYCETTMEQAYFSYTALAFRCIWNESFARRNANTLNGTHSMWIECVDASAAATLIHDFVALIKVYKLICFV